ncbi:MAG TPA: hypothetical protein VLM89_05485, partial [Phycisphaerae bacterium]|nr:hypothetical protein [Phycisphaerae bacterium]
MGSTIATFTTNTHMRGTPRLARSLVAIGNVYRRLLTAVLGIIGPRAGYAVTAMLARLLYRAFEPFRERSEAQCRAALGGRVPSEDIPRIAEQGFIHRIWNLADLMLADRLLHPGTFARYGGRIAEREMDLMREARRRGRPVIFVTAYHGPFDLLPVFLGFNGIRAGVIYRPHPNADYDAFRRRVRGRGGCELIPVQRAAERVGQLLAGGGAVAIVAD